MTPEIFLSLLAATVQAGTPILYATLGEIFTERSGVLNLGVEGIMLVGALAAFLAAMLTGSPLLAFVVGGLAGLLLAGVHGVVCLWFQGNQVVSGLALTILGTGLANYWGTPYIGQSAPGFYPFSLPLLGDLPVLGSIFFQHDLLV
ncbi:MAG TPA: ABC transporter permease, partial [Desulfomicrobiaceae bacterium]|nr:ABC transporter permease [Desulfomicrobiaceae bacterium]